ncbi:P-loop NTPase [bacterium]|nr:P-loop NTPase [bacterium]
MKQIVIMSGKGGTGKTTISAALAQMAGSDVVVADCDVDAANLHLLLKPVEVETERFFGGSEPLVDTRGCSQCGMCVSACAWNAIRYDDHSVVIDPYACEGCGICSHVCMDGHISMHPRVTGTFSKARTRFGQLMSHANLFAGQENSGKLVAQVRKQAVSIAEEQGSDCVLIDGPPGIGCPAISAVSGATHVLVVTEATQAGVHDMTRLVALLERFELDMLCVINKTDLDPTTRNEIHALCRNRDIPVIAEFPWSDAFPEMLRQGKTLLESEDEEVINSIEEIWNHFETVGAET